MSEAALARRPTRAGDFFQHLTSVFDVAFAGHPLRRRIRLAGETIEIRFAGPMLEERVMPALSHLGVDASAPASFTIDVFDSTSTGTSVSPPPWGPYDYLARGEIRGFNDERYRTAYRVDCGVLTMADLEAGRAVFWIRDEDLYPAWMRAAPLRNIFGWWAAWRRLQFIHGAAVGIGDRGLVLSGPSGSGKSTTAVRAALGGMSFLGDDYVLVDPGELEIHSVYSSAKLDGAAIERFAPQIARQDRGLVGAGGSEKQFYLGSDVFPSSVATRLGLVGLAVSVVAAGSATDVTAISPARALAALAPTTLFQIEGSSSEDLASMAKLVRTIPIFQLNIGVDDRVVEVLTALIERCGDD